MNVARWFTMAMALSLVLSLVLAEGCRTPPPGKPVTSVPPAAQKTIDQYAEGGVVHVMEMPEKHGMVFYDADVNTPDGSYLKLRVNSDGKLYKLDRLPAPPPCKNGGPKVNPSPRPAP